MAVAIWDLASARNTFQAFGLGVVLIALACIGRCIYNIYFHPLSNFPGPKFAASSNIWYGLKWTGGRWAYDIDDLHEKYGDVVRYAPNDLSFATANSWKDIYGHATQTSGTFIKGEWYDRFYEYPGIVSERSPEKHRETRRALSHAFSAKALREQTGIVRQYIDLLIEQFRTYGSKPEGIDVGPWFNYLTFDVIGDLAFGESFGAVKHGKSHFWIDMIIDSTFAGSLADVFGRMPASTLLAPFLLPLDLMSKKTKHDKLTEDKILARFEKSNDRTDFFGHMLKDKNLERDPKFFMSNASTLVVAGSETTATFLAATTYFLLANPTKLERLQQEVRPCFANSDMINQDNTASLAYLTAVIDEGLRLFPPAAFGLQRVSPGAMVDGHFIPKGTTVSNAIHTTARRDKYFHEAKSFHPERWLHTDHKYYDKAFANDVLDASKPFSTGPRACLGINLAYLEMRITLSKLIWNFDWELLSKDIDWIRDTKLELLWKKPEIRVRYTPTVRN